MTRIVSLSASAGDPTAVAGQTILYAKDDAGTIKPYIILSDGTVVNLSTGIGGIPANNYLIFKPGGGGVGPVEFEDWNVLYAQLQALQGASPGRYTILFDDANGSPIVVNPGVGAHSFDMANVCWEGIHAHAQVAVQVRGNGGESDGIVITNAQWFKNLHITSLNKPVFTAADGQTFYLYNTTMEGTGDYVIDAVFVGALNVVLDQQSSLLKGSNAAVRCNNSTVTVYVVGNNTTCNTRCIVSGVGGHAVFNIYSGSARVDQDQLDVTVDSFNMLTASGYYNADPNTKVTAQKGIRVYNTSTGDVWTNTNGATAWHTGLGKAGYVTLDTATLKTIVLATIPTVVEGATYAIDWQFTVPIPAAGTPGFAFAIESGDGAIGYHGFGQSGAGVDNRSFQGRTIITFGPAGATQDTLRSSQVISLDHTDDSVAFFIETDGPNAQTIPIDPSIRVKVTIDQAADTGQETIAHATVSRLA